MRIVYFTTAQSEKDFKTFLTYWKLPLNASNQNFHNKLIRALAVNHKVDVISIRPFSLSNTTIRGLAKDMKEESNITWHYIKRAGGKIYRSLTINPQVKSILKTMDLSDAIFMTDTINTSVVRAVTTVNKKYNRPIIGVCTDSPSNISGTTRSYTLFLLDKAQSYSGYLALTDGLNYLYNPEGKPSYIFEGIVEERKFEKSKEVVPPYFFFGGAMMEKYGLYQLIEAYKILKLKDIDLYICGHHVDKNQFKEATKNNPHIKYLGLLPVEKVMEYEANALACINPRPFTEDLDRFSIPSKTLEYMTSGRPVISVKNTILQKKFPDEVIWLDSANESAIVHGLKQVLKMSEEECNELGKRAKEKVLSYYSLENVANNLEPFLSQFIK